MAENNSISTLLPQLLRLYNNSLESFEKVNQAITSSNESVTVNIQNEDGSNSRITIPSFGYLKNSVDRLDSTINTITNIEGGDSTIRLSDGTFRKLVLSKLPSEAANLESINTVNNFGIKSNWFFDELINPLMYISFDLTGQVPVDTERAIIKRYILNTNSESKRTYFKNNFEGQSDIEYNDFLQKIVERNISYVLDESVISLPPREKRFTGKFSVIRISDVEFTEEVNGVTQTTQKKQYKFNKIFYTDTRADFDDTVQLKVGDSLEVVSDNIDTRYIIKSIDSSTNSVILELVEGTKPVLIGADVLKIGSNLNDNVRVDVPIGFDERCVVFIKPIDLTSKIPAVNWSPGSGFFTNDLTVISQDGSTQTLSNYYQNSVIDFGKYLLSLAKDKFPTSAEALKPNAPEVSSDNFKVELVNSQITRSEAVAELQELSSQKNTVESNLKELNNAIVKTTSKIQTTNYATTVERDADKNSLQGLITERVSKSELYSSLVKEIAAKGTDTSIVSVTPKYRVRGFWPLPKEKSTVSTGVQEIIKFKIRYRYLSNNGAANDIVEYSYIDGNTKNNGAFANWEIVESVLRPRVKNSVTGVYEWGPVNNTNADEVNINQLDIPIRKGEQVEIQIKSISEAGWPSNPIESDWSESVTVGFPNNLSSDNITEGILSQNQQDLAKVSLQEELNAMGIDTHLSSSFTANEKYFAHGAETIFSGFLSENQTPINLFAKLSDMQARLDEFSEILRVAQGELKVSLLNDEGNIISLNRDSSTKVFAGFYANEVKDLDDPRGAIVSKTFFINISNGEQTGLRLISRIAGSRAKMVKQSETPAYTESELINGEVIIPATYSWLNNSANNQSDGKSTYEMSDSDYNTIRKYDLVPLLLTNPTIDVDDPFGQDISLSPYQSAQNKNQFIYSRYKDVSAENTFYSYTTNDGDYTFNLDTIENYYERASFSSNSPTNDTFIWGGGFDENGYPTVASSYENPLGDNTIDVHINHPYIQTYFAYRQAYIELTRDETTLPETLSGDIDCTANGNGTAAVMFRHSKFIPLTTRQTKGKQQAIYLNENVSLLKELSVNNITFDTGQLFQASPTLVRVSALSDSNDPNFVNYSRNVKTSFESYDQYLLGKKSCGSYLFMSTDEHESIQVTGDSTQSNKIIQFGSQNSINIPIVFQYRMTDYYGVGTGVQIKKGIQFTGGGSGNIAGDITGAITNLTYTKKIGIDIFPNSEDVHQYDIEIFAKYKSDNLNPDVLPSTTVRRGLNDLEQVVSKLSPSVTETSVNRVIKSGGSNQSGISRTGRSSGDGV